MKQYPDRPFYGPADPDAYDEWLVSFWNAIVQEQDVVYLVGDFSFGEPEKVRRLVNRLQGTICLVIGNKDTGSLSLTDEFGWIRDIAELEFNRQDHPFLQEDFRLVLCHYPIVSWNKKQQGSCMVHGHCHGRIDEYNRISGELRVDAGINARLSRTCGGFISLEELYDYFRWASGNENLEEYVRIQGEKLVI
ncbi:MAG: hypothetical protein LIP04_04080 [Tannerellaceae bacterium]|nr:hypothetical protein [Tannerellaceae bacterium]